MADKKKFTPDQLKNAVKELNAILETGKIKSVGQKTEVILKSIETVVLKFIEDDKTGDLPEVVIDFYNDFISDDEEETKEEKPAAKGKKTEKTETKKADTKKTETKPEKEEKKSGKKSDRQVRSRSGNGLVAKAVDAYMNKGLRTTKELVEYLTPLFPDSPIGSTVSHVVCVLNHVDTKTDTE